MKSLKIYTDGGARGNPGPAAIGIVVKDESRNPIFQEGKTIGRATNNQAEYLALIRALEWLTKNASEVGQIDFFLDSTLVVSQANGSFKIKSPLLKPLWQKVKALEQLLSVKVDYHYIPRERNYQADSLVNKALDNQIC